MSGIVAFCTAWLQLRKPQILWSTYKTSQRELEVIKAKFQFKVDEYSDLSVEDSEKILIKKATEIIEKTNYLWVKQVEAYSVNSNSNINEIK